MAIKDCERAAITAIPTRVWTEAIDADGAHRDGTGLIELIHVLPARVPADHPSGTRVIVRRERPHSRRSTRRVQRARRVALHRVRRRHAVWSARRVRCLHRAHASYLPRDLTTGTAIEQQNTGPGGVYVRLEDAGHALTRFQEAVRIDQASEHEAAQLVLPVGAAVYRIRRIAHTATRPVEINLITAAGERYELYHEFPAE